MKSVFVVEDSPTVRMMVKALLKKAGFHVAGEAETGEEAVDAIKQASIDLVLMDLELPGISGMEATRALREWEQARAGSDGTEYKLCIVAMTAHSGEDIHRECMDAGMNAVTSKRIDAALLEQHIADCASMDRAA